MHLDGLAVLKIIKHCSENFPEAVAGSVLGLDVQDTLEVTHRFAFVKTRARAHNVGAPARTMFLNSSISKATALNANRDLHAVLHDAAGCTRALQTLWDVAFLPRNRSTPRVDPRHQVRITIDCPSMYFHTQLSVPD